MCINCSFLNIYFYTGCLGVINDNNSKVLATVTVNVVLDLRLTWWRSRWMLQVSMAVIESLVLCVKVSHFARLMCYVTWRRDMTSWRDVIGWRHDVTLLNMTSLFVVEGWRCICVPIAQSCPQRSLADWPTDQSTLSPLRVHNGHALLMHDTKRRLRERGFKNPVLLLHPLGIIVLDQFLACDCEAVTHAIVIDFLSVCPSVCLSNACIVTKRKHLAKKVQLWLIGTRLRAFQWA